MKKGNTKKDLIDWFNEYSPTIRYIDGSILQNNIYISVDKEPIYFDKNKILAWDWVSNGVNINKESQTENKYTYSIQYYLISELKKILTISYLMMMLLEKQLM